MLFNQLHKGIYYQADPPTGTGGGTAEPPKQEPPAEDPFPTSWEDVFKHPRFQQLNKKAQDAVNELERIRATEKAAADKALAEQNKWKELYEGTQKELSQEKVNNMRLKVAASKGLPADLVDRLRGETEEDLLKDADSLLAFMKPAEPRQGVPPIGRGGASPVINLATETDPAKVREAVRSGNYK